jgi:hypothetical protein
MHGGGVSMQGAAVGCGWLLVGVDGETQGCGEDVVVAGWDGVWGLRGVEEELMLKAAVFVVMDISILVFWLIFEGVIGEREVEIYSISGVCDLSGRQ